jgi:hypothetical protein
VYALWVPLAARPYRRQGWLSASLLLLLLLLLSPFVSGRYVHLPRALPRG